MRRTRRGILLCIAALALAILSPRAASTEPLLSDSLKQSALARIDTMLRSYQSVAAFAEIDSFIPLARAENDSGFLAEMLLRRGSLRTSVGQAERGEAALREALTLIREGSDLHRAGLRWLGVSVDNQGRNLEAEEIYGRLVEISTAAGDRLHQGWGLVGLAWQSLRRGEAVTSARLYRQALEHLAATGEVNGEAWARNGLGIALQSAGEHNEALASYEEALDLSRRHGSEVVELLALNNLGALSYSLGDPSVALEHFRTVERRHRELGNPRSVVPPALNVALCLIDLGRYRAAESGLDSLLTECRAAGYLDLEGMIVNRLAALNWMEKRHHRAAELYRHTIALGDITAAKHIADARLGLARALTAMDSCVTAMAVLEEGIAALPDQGLAEQRLLLGAWRGRCLQLLDQHEEAIAQFHASSREAEKLGLNLYLPRMLAETAGCLNALSMPDSALVLLRRAARLWEAEREMPLDPEWREQRGAAGRRIYSKLSDAILAGSRACSEKERCRDAFDVMQAFKARTLLERMLGPGNAFEAAASSGELTPITLDTLQWSVLREGELLLDFYLGEKSSRLFAVTREECRILPLPAAEEFEAKLRGYYQLLSQPPRGEDSPGERSVLSEAGAGLYRLLFADVGDLIATSRRVFFVPDGLLNLLPPGSLPASTTGESGKAGASWMRIPSATILARLRRDESPAERDGPVRGLALAGSRTPAGETLPGAAAEARSLGRRYRGIEVRILPDGEGKPVTHLQALTGFDLIHLAAHASADDQHPWNSAIHLHPGEERNGLSAAEIAASRLTARLAVLAGCESGGGRILSGEGVLGLSSAFLGAGVPAVLATLWPVDDRATARLMERFYAGLADGLGAAAALQRAQAALQGDPRSSHPFFWAGFVLVGDGEIRLRLERKGMDPLVLGLVILALVAAASFLARRQLRRQNSQRESRASL